VLTVGICALIVWNNHLYFDGGPKPRFFWEKGAIADAAWWKAAFYFHVVSASVCLLAGIPLMFPGWTKRHPQWHRRLGYLYINAVLWVAVPTGLILATVAKGGWLSSVGFGVAGLMLWRTTWVGYTAIRTGEITPHIRAMIRSYCWALTAPIFRLIQVALLPLEISDDANYIWSLWLSSAAAIMLAETCLWRMKLQVFPWKRFSEPIPLKGAWS
jgi:uncharacterized membrane protein